MMKIFIPKNISGGWFSMSVQVGPASISVLQLIILAIGLGIGLSIRNKLYTSGVSRMIAFMIALPIMLLFVFIAFFKYSELSLLPFIAKMVKTYFLDATRKFQVNWLRPDPKAVVLAKSRTTDHSIVIEQKDFKIDKDKLQKMKPLLTQDGNLSL